MVMRNATLNKAKNAKNDEFYTQLTDIEKELRHYRKHFRGKTVLCNCDDPTWSAFWKYFHLNFNTLGLKKLISTHYDKTKSTYKMEYTGGDDNDIEVGVKTPLEGNGDFRNQECLDSLDEADIVVTNPPFSLFREYVSILMEHKKKFIIIGNINAVTYKEFFPLIMENKVWFGASIHSGDRKFYVPDDYPLNAAGCGVDADGRHFIRVKGVRWYTNLDLKQRHEEMILVKRYSPEEYPRYVNYDAIEVSKTNDIPLDYDGLMGVPITFLDKYSPDQFEIVGITRTWFGGAVKTYEMQTQVSKNGTKVSKNGTTSTVSKLNDNPALKVSVPPKDKTYYVVGGEYFIQMYARILIRNKHPEQPNLQFLP